MFKRPYKVGYTADGNEAEIAEALEADGWEVWQIGWPLDLLVRRDGVIGVIEVKNPNGKHEKLGTLRPVQERFILGGGNTGVVFDTDMALALAATFK